MLMADNSAIFTLKNVFCLANEQNTTDLPLFCNERRHTLCFIKCEDMMLLSFMALRKVRTLLLSMFNTYSVIESKRKACYSKLMSQFSETFKVQEEWTYHATFRQGPNTRGIHRLQLSLECW